MSKIKILIVEDILFVAKDIEEMLLESGYEISGVVNSDRKALECFQKEKPDLVLMDITLKKSDMNGIQIAEKMNELLKVPLIYITGDKSNKTIAKAAHTNPANYIIKPFTQHQLDAAITVAITNFYGLEKSSENKQSEKNEKKDNFFVFKDRIFLNVSDDYKKVHKSEILFFEANSNQSYAYIKNINEKKIEKHFMYSGLVSLEERLSHFDELFRIHRSYIINMKHVESFSKKNMCVYLKDYPKPLPISKNNFGDFLTGLENL